MKMCKGCRETKPLEAFSKDNRMKTDGRLNTCKVCRRAVTKKGYDNYRKTPKGLRSRAWVEMRKRVDGQEGCYKGVEVRMTKEEFYNWSLPIYEMWVAENPGVSPSVDRINEKGHYELGNIRIISMRENAERASINYYAQLKADREQESILNAVRRIPTFY